MATHAYDDYTLVKACCRGKTEAFKLIVQKYQNYVCTLTFSATGDQHKSEELAQEIFVTAWNKLSQLRDYRKFKSWLYRIAQNHIHQFYRSTKRDVMAHAGNINAQVTASEQMDPQRQAISKENEQFVLEALNRIPVQYRDPLILFYWEGKSIRQVARQFDLTEVTAKKRLSRGRAMVKSNILAAFEQTLSNCRPRENFALLVVWAITAGTLATAGTASAATIGSHAGNSGWFSAIKAHLTGKITVAAAAVIVTISAGTYVVHENNTNKTPPPYLSRQRIPTLSEPLKAGLVMYLSFDDIRKSKQEQPFAFDESWQKNHGMITGGKIVKGIIGNAIQLNAKNKTDGIIVKDNDSLDLKAVTIAAWIKTDNVDNQWNRILDKGWKDSYNFCIGGEFKGQEWYRDRIQLECAGQPITSKGTVTDGQWHFVAGTYDGATSRIYIDGKLNIESKNKKITPMKPNDVDIQIGMLAVPEEKPYDEAFFDGLIDELRLYNRVLAPWEISTLYRYQPEL